MIKFHFSRFALSIFTVFLMVLVGCAGSSSPTRFYTLNTLSKPEVKQEHASPDRDFVIGVGPIVLPDYLDRPQIVTRTGDNELKLDEFHRWAGELKNGITRVISENLSILRPTDRVYSFPLNRSIPLDILVKVEFIRFDGVLGDIFILEAKWSIYGEKKKKELLMRSSSFREPVEGQEYSDLVAAQNRTLADLSRDIAVEINSILQEVHDK